jgi:hypothetical protein
MKSKKQLRQIVPPIQISSSLAGMDAVDIHAMNLDTLENIERRLVQVESRLSLLEPQPAAR